MGGIAVVATLSYLAMQVRQGNRLARAQAQQDSARMSTEILAGSDRESMDLFAQAMSNPEPLPDSDRRVLATRFVAVVSYSETLFYASERGDVDPDLWESRRYRMANFIAPLKDALWEPTKLAFGRRFREFIDRDLIPNFASADSPWIFGPPGTGR